jgi:23S rRNA (cytosine1962-C5)-methyltransferase
VGGVQDRPGGKVMVGARGAARVLGGHPWVYRVDVARPPDGDPDDVAVTDERGRPLGAALWAPAPAPIALRLYARGAFASWDGAWPAALARSVARRGGARVGRLVHGEADGVPGLFVDRYEDVVVLQSATRAVDRREDAIAARLRALLDVRLVAARDDGSARDHEGLPRRKGVLAGAGPTRVTYAEGAARFTIDVLEDAKTGGFLDQRENHLRVAELARGEALDAFTYHGGFALALARGAERVVALDEDPQAVARARANAAASGLANVEVHAADAFAELRRFEREGRRFDVVVVDPPALAKRKGVDALRAYKELNLRAFRIARPGGWLVTCSCSGKITAELFEGMLVEAVRDAGRDAHIVERRGAAADHPVLLGLRETEYLKCFVLRVL